MGKVYTSGELIKLVEADGWLFVRQNSSSHAQYKHPTKKGTSASVLRQAGLK